MSEYLQLPKTLENKKKYLNMVNKVDFARIYNKATNLLIDIFKNNEKDFHN